MSKTIQLDLHLNRVEGDLEVRVQVAQGVVTDVRAGGSLFRGFERLLVGRGHMDGLVLTPRICGICSMAHLRAAVEALERIGDIRPPPNAVRLRNAALMIEQVQSDVRHAILMFAGDMLRSRYASSPLFAEACRRYQPFQGESVQQAVGATRDVIDAIAIIGGQWPHTSFMVPGGVTTLPSQPDILRATHYVDKFQAWYEKRVLGCTCARWLEVGSRADLNRWLEECDAHRESELGFFMRFALAEGFDGLGAGHQAYLSFGNFPLPEGAGTRRRADRSLLVPAGHVRGLEKRALDPRLVAEHASHCWYTDHPEPLHPSRGVTTPYASGDEDQRYSWGKAPRYAGSPCETGPLAERMVAGHSLFNEIVRTTGGGVFARQLARITRPATVLGTLHQWLSDVYADEPFYEAPTNPIEGSGEGLIEAARGALGHWVEIHDRRITHYQVIAPTTWNASPRDDLGVRGPIEEALMNSPVRDPNDPVELEHIVRSFDPCLVCTVH